MRFVYAKRNKEAFMFLIEVLKNGKSGLKLLPPLIVHNSNGIYCDEIKKMFGDD